MKRNFLLLSLFFICLIFTGCSSGSSYNLTDEEEDAIAQYAAHLILKYDANGLSDEKLLDPDQLEDAETTEAEADEAAEETIIAIVTPTPTPVVTVPDSESGGADDFANTATPEPTTAPTADNSYSLSECLCADGLTVEYAGYTECQVYKADTEYYSITAPEGQKIVVIDFRMTNNGEEAASYTAAGKSTKYQLLTAQGTLSPRISLLADDLQYLNISVPAGASADAVLLFFADSDTDQMSLKISGNYTESNVNKVYNIIIK